MASSTRAEPAPKPSIAFVLGLPLAVILGVYFKMAAEASGWDFIGVAAYVVVLVLPLAVANAVLTLVLLFQLRRPGAIRSICVLWLPTVLTLAVGGALDRIRLAREKESALLASHANAPGSVYFIDATDNVIRSDETRLRGSYLLRAPDATTSPGRYVQEESLRHYDGYKLLADNEVLWLTDSDSPPRHLPLTPPDYQRIAALVNSGPDAPADAWLWPQQVDTGVYIYPTHVETAPVISRINNDQGEHATEVRVHNYTGWNLVRVRINGWDVIRETFFSAECGSPRDGFVPESLKAPIHVEWQTLGESEWHGATLDRLADAPDAPKDKERIGKGLDLMIGWAGSLSARPFARVVGKESPDNATDAYAPDSQATVDAFLANYRGCTPVASQRPQHVVLYNLTDLSVQDATRWFFDTGPNQNSPVRNITEPEFFAANFDGYRLKPGLSLDILTHAENKPVTQPRKMPVPLPDYTQMDALLQSPLGNNLTTADFSIGAFLYADHIESAVLLTRSTRVARPLQSFMLSNHSGHSIARMQVNGLDINEGAYEQSGNIRACGFSITRQVPPITAPLTLRWQYDHDPAWHVKRFDALPSAPEVPQGALADEPLYSFYIGKKDETLLTVERVGLEKWTDGEMGCNGTVFGDAKATVESFLKRTDACE